MSSEKNKWSFYTRIIYLAIIVVIIGYIVSVVNSSSESNIEPNSSNSSRELELDQELFRESINQATEASRLTQSAATLEDWEAVEQKWSDAIRDLNDISGEYQKRELVEQKIAEYEENREYAKQVIQNKTQQAISQAQPLIKRIEQKSGFKPRIDTWGSKPTLFLTHTSWTNLEKTERDILIEYAKTSGYSWQIITGGYKNSDTIFVDQTVCSSSIPIDRCYENKPGLSPDRPRS